MYIEPCKIRTTALHCTTALRSDGFGQSLLKVFHLRLDRVDLLVLFGEELDLHLGVGDFFLELENTLFGCATQGLETLDLRRVLIEQERHLLSVRGVKLKTGS